MLRVASVLTRSRDVRYVEGSAEALPLPDDFATVVWALSTMHHWHDVDDGLAEVRRVLRPGGRGVAIERRTVAGATGLASHGWTDEQADVFTHVCADRGFTDLRIERPPQTGRRRIIAVVASRVDA